MGEFVTAHGGAAKNGQKLETKTDRKLVTDHRK